MKKIMLWSTTLILVFLVSGCKATKEDLCRKILPNVKSKITQVLQQNDKPEDLEKWEASWKEFALSQLSDTQDFIENIGRGDNNKKIREQAESLANDWVQIFGYASVRRVPELLRLVERVQTKQDEAIRIFCQ